MVIDYILVNNRYRSRVKDVKVILGEEVVGQHCLLVMDVLIIKDIKKKKKFRKKLKLRTL